VCTQWSSLHRATPVSVGRETCVCACVCLSGHLKGPLASRAGGLGNAEDWASAQLARAKGEAGKSPLAPTSKIVRPRGLCA
jgi:hypothetical protein